MFNEISKEINWNGTKLKISTGKIAQQANGAVVVTMGDSVVLCTVTFAKEMKEGLDFFPLTVIYREMAFAAGKIPGGFFKREGKASEKETLVSRLIDRPIRPLFHSDFFNETHITCTVLSYDSKCPTDILSIIGSSAALAISGAPCEYMVAAARVGLINDEFILNPANDIMKNSKLDLVVAGTESSVMMVESEAKFLSEEQMLNAVKFAHIGFRPVIELIKELSREVNKPKLAVQGIFPNSLKERIAEIKGQEIAKAFAAANKQERHSSFTHLKSTTIGVIKAEFGQEFNDLQISLALEEVKSEYIRKKLLKDGQRIDGRRADEVRQISCEVGFLPKVHGSGLFTRGETQVLATTTLGTNSDEQIIDDLAGEYKERFMLNYIFPPYSVGEALPMRAPGRREIGHGKLAWRAINPVLPSKESFPYSFRVVAEVTACNGSSSMATICSTSLALMDAGVPIVEPVSGIAMGLIKENEKYIILSDIISDEDFLGDMDFKVAGSTTGITALQMDIKTNGITFEILEEALSQAKVGRKSILENMNEVILKSREEISKYAPTIKVIKIEKDKIRDIIGPGGKIIREICETTGAKIDISDEGVVSISAIGQDKMDLAISKISALAFTPQVGDVFSGSVVKMIDSGVFINYLGNKDGFVHISEISHKKLTSVNEALNLGDIVQVKIVGFDSKGRTKLTIKGLIIDASPKEANEDSAKSDEGDSGVTKQPAKERTKYRTSPKEVTSERKYFS